MDYNMILDSYNSFWLNAFKIKGRTRRRDYWIAMLINIAVSIMLANMGRVVSSFTSVYNFFSLMAFVPTITINIRRLHDIGKRGWYIILSAVPLLGIMLLGIWFLGDSQPGTNKFGENPKGVSAAEAK